MIEIYEFHTFSSIRKSEIFHTANHFFVLYLTAETIYCHLFYLGNFSCLFFLQRKAIINFNHNFCDVGNFIQCNFYVNIFYMHWPTVLVPLSCTLELWSNLDVFKFLHRVPQWNVQNPWNCVTKNIYLNILLNSFNYGTK